MTVVEFYNLRNGDVVKTTFSPECVVVEKGEKNVSFMDNGGNVLTDDFWKIDFVRQGSLNEESDKIVGAFEISSGNYKVSKSRVDWAMLGAEQHIDDALLKMYKAGHYDGAHEKRSELSKFLVLDPKLDWNNPYPCDGCPHQTIAMKIGCVLGGCNKKAKYIEKDSLLRHFRKIDD